MPNYNATKSWKKRKRVKSNVLASVRCLALRSCSEQCSRRRSVSSYYCGTHKKGIPHGSLPCSLISSTDADTSVSSSSSYSDVSSMPSKKVEVCAHEIDGIMFYLDNIKHVYCPEDIHMQKHNPLKIGTYNQIGDKIQIQLYE